jgi:hypothetical protein
MPDLENKVPGHFEEKCIVVTVPTGTSKREIEKQIHEALAEEPDDVFIGKGGHCKGFVIMLLNEGNHK